MGNATEFQRFLAWCLLVFVVGFLATRLTIMVRRWVTKYEFDDFWNDATPEQKWIIGAARAAGWGLTILAVFSPLYFEFPNIFGQQVVATIEGGKLVYHTFGLFEGPLGQKDQKKVLVFRDSQGMMLKSLVRNNRGEVGRLIVKIRWRISDVNRFYTGLPEEQRDPISQRQLFSAAFVDVMNDARGLDLTRRDDPDGELFCKKFEKRFFEISPVEYPVKIESCHAHLNTSPLAFD